jgi:hypothetical protein
MTSGKQFINLKNGDNKKWDIALSTRLGEGSFGKENSLLNLVVGFFFCYLFPYE